jgi:hypothetical protein
MRIRDAFGIYHVLETLIKQSAQPLTCVELYDESDVKKFADSVNRVSDYLGHMYRQGLLGRVPAPKSPNSQARFAYYWKNRSEAAAAQAATATSEPALQRSPRTVLKKPSIEISEHGEAVVIDLAELVITIRTKS